MDAYANFASDARAFAGGGGGGFMPSQPGDQFGGGAGAGGGGSAFKRSGGGGADGNKREVSTLRALTVRQLLRGQQQADDAPAAPDGRVSVDGADVHNATLLGRVLSVQEGGQRTTLVLHDGTGAIEVSKWRMDDDGGVAGGGQPRVAVGSYVRVFGHLRAGGGGGGRGGAGGGGMSFHAFAVRPVTDHNEVTYHLLQCAFQHGHLTRGGAGTGLAGKMGAAQPAAAAYGVGAYGAAAAPAAATPTAGQQRPGSLQEAITAVLSDPSVGENGLHVNDVVQRVRAAAGPGGGALAAASLADVQAALSALMNEALAYTTVDDSHWKST
jgi:replication factor A2